MLMRTVRRRAASVALAALLAGCTAWHPYASDLAARPTGRLPPGLRITRTDGSRVMLVAPFVRGDTVLGTWNRDTLAVPLGAVRVVEREDLSAMKTALFLLGVPLLVAAILAAIPRYYDT